MLLERAPVDRVPVAAWRHFIPGERSVDALAAASLKHFEDFDWDWLKLNPRADAPSLVNGHYDRIVLAYFVACGVSRLARYNVTAEALTGDEGKVKYFEGTPIPTSLVLVLVMFVAATQGALRQDLWFGKISIAGFGLHPLVLMFAVSGSLMVSRIRFPKL